MTAISPAQTASLAVATTDLLPLAAPLRVIRIESLPFGENTYVVAAADAPACAIVDPGFEPDAIVTAVEAHGLEPAMILLTHGHSDHIAGCGAIRERWPGLPILVGRLDADKLTDPVGNLSAPFGLPFTAPPADRLLDDGDIVDCGPLRFAVRDLPGHSRGHVVFLVGGVEPPVVLGGDVLFAGSIGRTDFVDGDFATLEAGIRDRLYTLPDATIVLPGHGEPTTVGQERRHNPFVSGRGAPD